MILQKEIFPVDVTFHLASRVIDQGKSVPGFKTCSVAGKTKDNHLHLSG
jgi:hypothetical protein